MADLNASQRRGLVRKVKSWLRRPATLQVAVGVLKALDIVLRLIDFFR